MPQANGPHWERRSLPLKTQRHKVQASNNHNMSCLGDPGRSGCRFWSIRYAPESLQMEKMRRYYGDRYHFCPGPVLLNGAVTDKADGNILTGF